MTFVNLFWPDTQFLEIVFYQDTMNLRAFLFELFPSILRFKLARAHLIKPPSPITLTFSITAACQSDCRTCNIGARYHADPSISKKDLSLSEIEQIFKSIGHIYFFNISGGEPFLRKDLPDIVRLACKYLKPGIIHIPTNALASETIRDSTKRCLEIMHDYSRHIPLTVKPSIDGVGKIHDEIRGVKGNFKQLEKTIRYLKAIEHQYSNFYLELGTVISKFNIDHLSEIEDYVHSLGVQSYRNEIAENRMEFFNLEDDITPDVDTYANLIPGFSAKIRQNIRHKRPLARITESFRLTYYDLAGEILRKHRQVIPCYAAISNVHINYDGEVWPCCVLGYSKPIGSLREVGYDFQRVWHSGPANRIRGYIKDGNCACPLANQAYSNILSSPIYLFKTFINILRLATEQHELHISSW